MRSKAGVKDYSLKPDTFSTCETSAGEVPVSEVVCAWIDPDLNRAFAIMKRVRQKRYLCPKQRPYVRFKNSGCRTPLNHLFRHGYQGPLKYSRQMPTLLKEPLLSLLQTLTLSSFTFITLISDEQVSRY